MVLATLSFALMGAITKLLGNRYPSVELVFFRNLIGTMLILISIWNKPLIQTGGKWNLLVFRGSIGATSLFAFYYCLTKMQLAVANTYNLTYPLFIGFMSVFILKKKTFMDPMDDNYHLVYRGIIYIQTRYELSAKISSDRFV